MDQAIPATNDGPAGSDPTAGLGLGLLERAGDWLGQAIDWYQGLPLPVLVLIAVIMMVVTLLYIGRLIQSLGTGPTYASRGTLFTPAELKFLAALDVAVAGQLRVFGKIRVADVLQVRDGTRRRDYAAAFNRIARKHVDFVLVDPVQGTIEAALELDDRSHDKAERRERDVFLDAAFAEAGLPLIRVAAARRYDVVLLADTLAQALKLDPARFAGGVRAGHVPSQMVTVLPAPDPVSG